MKSVKNAVTALFLFLTSIGFAQKAEITDLVAPVYPGSVTANKGVNDNLSQTFYAKDSYEKVRTFFEEVYGKPHVYQFGACNEAQVLRDVYVLGCPNVDSFIVARDSITWRPLSVLVMAKPKKDNFYVSQAFAHLQNAYLARFTSISPEDKLKRINDAELQNVFEKFRYLKGQFFLKIPVQKNGNEEYMGIEELLYNQFFQNPQDLRRKRINELMEEYTSLVQQGRMDEAMKLSDKINMITNTAGDSSETWNNAVTYLRELEKLSFNTLIVIDKKRTASK